MIMNKDGKQLKFGSGQFGTTVYGIRNLSTYQKCALKEIQFIE